MVVKEKARETRVVKHCDVLVAGGGVAGIAAAVAAARGGAKVILCEKQCALGGLATLGLITIYLPLCDGMGNQIIYGIGEELLRLSIRHGHEARYPKAWLEGGTPEEKRAQRFQVQYNPWLFALCAEELLLSLGVELVYDSKINAVVTEEGRVTHVILDNKEGRLAIETKAAVDATGDADLFFFAGETVEYFRENRFSAWHYVADRDGVRLHPMASDYNKPLREGERSYDGVETDGVTAMIVDGHRAVLESIINGREEKNDQTLVPTAIPLVPLFRMTRRLKGLYELDESEDKQTFTDSVGMTGDWRKRGPVFNIPFRCLVGPTIKNLIAAGRMISVTRSMWEISRVIPTCAVTGEAAGTAAAQLVKSELSSFRKLDVASLQATLRSNGVRINAPVPSAAKA